MPGVLLLKAHRSEGADMSAEGDCIFCQIAKGDIPAAKLFENERLVAFSDIQPVAPFHILVVPREHIATINDLRRKDQSLLGEMVLLAQKLAGEAGLAESGYRLVLNCNADAGQVVFHLHLHVIGGKPLGGLVS